MKERNEWWYLRVLLDHSFREVTIEGTADELLHLAGLLGADGARMDSEWIDGDSDPAPFERAIAAVEIRHRPGKLVVFAVEDALEVSGDPTHLGLVEANLRVAATALDSGEHVHLDHYPGHPFLSPQSFALVLVKQGPGCAQVK